MQQPLTANPNGCTIPPSIGSNLLDTIDFDDPRILADIRAVFAVLASIPVEEDICSTASSVATY